jgi:phosphoribosylformylglycinamidine cyclo-ligase
VHSISHITGGGIAANVARVLPAGLALDLDRATWSPQPIFTWLRSVGNLAQLDAEKTFNMGIGMLAFVPAGQAQLAITSIQAAGLNAWECGVVRSRKENEIGDSLAKGGIGGVTRLVNRHSK